MGCANEGVGSPSAHNFIGWAAIFYAKDHIVLPTFLADKVSDAVAIGVRFKVPIYSYERVLDEAGIIIDEEEEEASRFGDESSGLSLSEIEKSDPIEEEPKPARRPRSQGKSSKAKLKDLQQKLDEALAGEDYETAARLRDEIQKLGGSD